MFCYFSSQFMTSSSKGNTQSTTVFVFMKRVQLFLPSSQKILILAHLHTGDISASESDVCWYFIPALSVWACVPIRGHSPLRGRIPIHGHSVDVGFTFPRDMA